LGWTVHTKHTITTNKNTTKNHPPNIIKKPSSGPEIFYLLKGSAWVGNHHNPCERKALSINWWEKAKGLSQQ